MLNFFSVLSTECPACSNGDFYLAAKKQWHTACIRQGRLASGFNGRGCVMNYPNKREIIQEILEENGSLDWYVAQPNKQNPASGNAKCILLNFVEKKRAELIIPNDWFQDPCRYGGISELIWLAVQNSTPVESQHTAHYLFSFPRQHQNGNRGGYRI